MTLRLFSDGVEYFPVTNDPVVMARLRAQEAITPDTLELAEFAVAELGLTPPDHQEGDPLPDIASIYPPDHPDGVYIWDVHELDDEELGEDQPSVEQRSPSHRRGVGMIYDGIEYFPVTTDDALVALLREKEADGAGAHELADYAATELGLRPPDHQPGDLLPLIVEVFPPDMDHGVYVWNIHEYFDEELGED